MTKTTIPVNTTIPTDPTELATYKAVLIEGFSEFTPNGTITTDVNVYYTNNRRLITTSASAVAEFISEDSFTCSSDSCDETLATRESEMTQVAITASLPGEQGLKGSVDIINNETGTNVEINALGEFQTETNGVITPATPRPTPAPTPSPSEQPTTRPSSTPKPSLTTSVQPTEPPIKLPTRAPTKSST